MMLIVLGTLGCTVQGTAETVSADASDFEGLAIDAVDSDGDGVFDDQDCSPQDALSYPGAPELCDATDNDCNGDVDDGDACDCEVAWYGGHAYQLCDFELGWGGAASHCEEGGYDLVTIDDQAENAWLWARIENAGFSRWWIGLHDRQHEGQYQWRDGSQVSFETWRESEPDGHDENCTELDADNGAWGDRACGLDLPFVCEAAAE